MPSPCRPLPISISARTDLGKCRDAMIANQPHDYSWTPGVESIPKEVVAPKASSSTDAKTCTLNLITFSPHCAHNLHNRGLHLQKELAGSRSRMCSENWGKKPSLVVSYGDGSLEEHSIFIKRIHIYRSSPYVYLSVSDQSSRSVIWA